MNHVVALHPHCPVFVPGDVSCTQMRRGRTGTPDTKAKGNETFSVLALQLGCPRDCPMLDLRKVLRQVRLVIRLFHFARLGPKTFAEEHLRGLDER